MRIAMFQMANAGSVDANLAKSLRAIGEAAQNGADLILFPEVQLTDFFPQYPGRDARGYLTTMDGAIVRAFCTAAREHHIMVVPNVYLAQNGHAYDASILIDENGKALGVQKMVHVAQAPQFYERDYYTPADDGFHVFETAHGRIGIVVCFDRHYPESMRTQALRGADLILIPTVNTKAEPSAMFLWEVRVQAFQNSVAAAMCNRVGKEDAMVFSGESIVVDAEGNLLCQADDTEQLIYADVDLSASRRIRGGKPYTSLRRPTLYE